ncbi:tetratricopeptide repeat protein [Streptomyces sp. BE230]|uniref:tetratricopeptide repeat protein n=1 Tax=Streptomyces sp. BE230 TaxID=3002526 RepID=UPI002ED53321|nr:hypothetical protein [Streptomyces sp. BE230]
MPPDRPSGPPPAEPPGPVPPGAVVRAVAVALLNLTGLGLGYVLVRRWFRAFLCWVATGWLLLAALPADPDGMSGGLVTGYLLVLAVAAGDGAWTARRAAVGGSWRPVIAAGAGLALLAVPAGGAVYYGSAQDEAVEQMLLDRLDEGDRSVEAASAKPFGAAQQDYRSALAVYRELGEDHAGSRAGKLVPARLDAYYRAIAAPYRQKKHCEAIEPLTYLRSVPDSIDPGLLGDLARYPDEPLADSLYACGVSQLRDGSAGASGGALSELLRTFPGSPQAGQVGPAVSKEIAARTGAVRGDGPCAATEQLRQLRQTTTSLPDKDIAALAKDADGGIRNGVYACGLDEFKDKEFGEARRTLTGFADTYRKDKRRGRAQDIAIAAEIADTRPAAGKRLPPGSAPGGARMELVISNDAPDGVEILYTGPVTGRVAIKGCGSCTSYSWSTGALRACKNTGKSYPHVTLRLPAGEYHFLYKHREGSAGSGADATSYADGSKIEPGYRYTGCTYVTSSTSFGSGLTDPVAAG